MSFDFKSCFWDPHDEGVTVLLQHISQGIRSIATLEQFFKTRGELSKDYSRRLGAIDEKLNKDLNKTPDFGRLNDMLLSLSSIERARANAFSKQYGLIQSNLYHEIKIFNDNLKAKYTTLTGKIDMLQRDKFDKRKGCEDLSKRLNEAEMKYREYKLNENNIIGSKRIEQNNRDIIKWETNFKEIKSQLSILKHEYKASQRFWLKEWAIITQELQDLESERITFIQTKLSEFTNINIETSILEQTKLDYLNNELTTFTAMDDISKFSNDYGTGRLKEKHQYHHQLQHEPPRPHAASTHTTTDNNMMSKRESYMENIRQLSNQLQKSSLSRQKSISNRDNVTIPSNNKLQNGLSSPVFPTETTLPVSKQRNTNRYSLHESQLPSYSNDQYERKPQSEQSQSPSYSNNQYERKPRSEQSNSPQNNDRKPQYDLQHNKTQSESSTTSSSSNPTDFTSHINRRRSIESMSTSVTSIASTIDDNQRFAKSWNSTNNRKRKSMSHIASYLEQSPNTTETKPITATRTSSTNTILMKSLDTSKINIPHEMNKLQGGVAKDSKIGRVNDNGIIVTLPIVTKTGSPVIKYAKALYPLLDDTSAPEVINFDKNDYLLITEEINTEWFIGEVYDNEKIHPDHRFGLIPYNFIEILD
ncbi:cytokinesis protein 2 [Monosporozyma servazzii]